MNILVVFSVLLMSFSVLYRKADSVHENRGLSVISSVYIKAVCSLVIIFHHLSFSI